jgi:hypothetical protein
MACAHGLKTDRHILVWRLHGARPASALLALRSSVVCATLSRI